MRQNEALLVADSQRSSGRHRGMGSPRGKLLIISHCHRRSLSTSTSQSPFLVLPISLSGHARTMTHEVAAFPSKRDDTRWRGTHNDGTNTNKIPREKFKTDRSSRRRTRWILAGENEGRSATPTFLSLCSHFLVPVLVLPTCVVHTYNGTVAWHGLLEQTR